MEKYEEELEHERLLECQKAMEKEIISKSMQHRREDEMQLREMQKMQMKEKEYIAATSAEIDEMWHQVLLNDVRKKEEKEKIEAERLKREMQERRQAYDEQIAGANQMMRSALKIEGEKENRRIAKINKKMEEDYRDAIKNKKEEQTKNRRNYIEGHEIKTSALRNRKLEERLIDQKTIDVALNELRQERNRKMAEIKSFQREKQLCIQNKEKERQMLTKLEIDTERVVEQWREESERECERRIEALEREKRNIKEKFAKEYRALLKEMEKGKEIRREEKRKIREDVNRTAFREIELKLERAKEELRRQEEYRRNLEYQIQNNQKVMEIESINMDMKQKPFTKKEIMFKDAMKYKMNESRMSTNPVHPFRRLYLQKEGHSSLSLPVILK